MLTINLGKGQFDVISGHEKQTVRLNEVELPVKRYEFSREAHLANLPDIDYVYQQLGEAGLSGERIIDEPLSIYLPIRIFRAGHFAKVPLVLGFLGPRGSGKTVGAVGIICLDWLLRNETCWSNVPIAVRVIYKRAEKVFRSVPLSKLDLLDLGKGYRSGVVFVDEVNMEAGEATRAMSGANLQFSYQLQQIRKRQLSVIWTVQGWMWVDNRLRWQTDFVVSCRDAFLSKTYQAQVLGEKSIWRVFDLAGLTGEYDAEYELTHRYISDFQVWEGAFLNQVFWHAYDTGLLQGERDYIQDYRDTKRGEATQRRLEVARQRQVPAGELVKRLLDTGVESFWAEELWRENGIVDIGERQAIGRSLKQYYERRRAQEGYYYAKRQ